MICYRRDVKAASMANLWPQIFPNAMIELDKMTAVNIVRATNAGSVSISILIARCSIRRGMRTPAVQKILDIPLFNEAGNAKSSCLGNLGYDIILTAPMKIEFVSIPA